MLGRTLALVLSTFLAVGCGGQVADEDDTGSTPSKTPSPAHADPLSALRARCNSPWKSPLTSDAKPSTTIAAGRWLRCTAGTGTAFVTTFEGIELSADGTFTRLAVGPNGFEPKTGALGDTGKWSVMRSGDLEFELPSCAEGRVEHDGVSSCGGFDVVTPLFETTPTRMRFYGASFWYVKDE